MVTILIFLLVQPRVLLQFIEFLSSGAVPWDPLGTTAPLPLPPVDNFLLFTYSKHEVKGSTPKVKPIYFAIY